MTTTMTLADLKSTVARLNAGDMTPTDLVAAFDAALASKPAIVAEVSKTMTVAELKKKRWFHSTKKAGIVAEYVNSWIGALAIGGGTWQPMSETYATSQRRNLLKVTPEIIAAHAAAHAERVAERKAQIDAYVKSVTDPATLDEYRTFVKTKNEAELSDEKIAHWDILEAEDAIAKRAAEEAQRAKVERVELGDVTMEITESVHTKRGCPIWYVKATERVDRCTYLKLKEAASRFGARWSSWDGNEGFLFFDHDDARTFAGITEGEIDLRGRWERFEEARQQRAAQRLADQAEHRDDQAASVFAADTKTNTVRRAAMRESALSAADRLQKQAGVLASISQALADGRLRFLARVRFGADIETLETVIKQARDNAVRAEFDGRNIPEGEFRRPVRLSDIRLAAYPWPRLDRDWVRSIIDACTGRRNIARPRYLLQQALASANGSGWVEISGVEAVEGLIDLLDRFDVDHSDYMMERTLDARRLMRMGIYSRPHLRAALREYMGEREERPSKIDRVALMELDLVGRNIPGYFPTPRDLVTDSILPVIASYDWSGAAVRFLEPEAGKGSIAVPVDAWLSEHGISHSTVACETNSSLRAILQAKGIRVVGDDFLEHHGQYDLIVMNPPFEDGQDMAHVRHAYSLLADDGVLVAITSPGPFFHQDKNSKDFRDWLDEIGGQHEDLPAGSFKSSDRPTGVATCLVTIEK